MKKSFMFVFVFVFILTNLGTVWAQETTDVGTPRNETLVVQTFDRQTTNPDAMNPLMNSFAVWRGFRELGTGFLWETDTGNGQSYPELAAELPKVLNAEHTKFGVTLKKGIYWSDGVEFTADDIVYTLDTYFKLKDKLTWFGVAEITTYIKNYKKIDNYSMEFETVNPAYDFVMIMGVATWSSHIIFVPKHIFEKQADVTAFRNTNPVTLGPYTVKSFDPNGFWQLWQRRDDWQRSSWGWMGEPKAKYVLYKDFGPEETRSLAFIQNKYDVDTFMSPESIKAAQGRNNEVKTFSATMPYHNMDDACSYGILMNMQRVPLDKPEVRWALALALDVKSVGINALNGEFKASPLPMVDTQILRPLYFTPLISWLKDFALSDGYKPFDENFAKDLAGRLQQTGAKDIPDTPEGLSKGFGIGWWKYDTAEAEKLLKSVGFTKNADGKWQTPDSKVWQLEFVIPGDWNKVMQRVGFSIADSWQGFGIDLKVRQVDNAEFGNVQNINGQRQTELNWTNCIFNPNYLTSWRSIRLSYINPADSSNTNSGNQYQWSNKTVDGLVQQSLSLEFTSDQFQAIGRQVIQEFVKDMAYINIMNIPTTIPTNEHYWTNFPHQDNYYGVPYTWWSSFKKILVNIKPTGK